MIPIRIQTSLLQANQVRCIQVPLYSAVSMDNIVHMTQVQGDCQNEQMPFFINLLLIKI